MNGGIDHSVDNRRDGGVERWLPAVRRHAPAIAGHAARATVWAIVHFVAGFVGQVAEFGAPLLLVLGFGWYALPHLLGLITTDDGEMRDVLNGLASHVPSQLAIGDHVLTPASLIFDGLLLMAVAAALSTLVALLSRELYRG